MTRIFQALALVSSALVAPVAAGYAATPQSTVKSWQDSAPEAFEVMVLSVNEEKRQERLMAPNCTQTIQGFLVTAKVEVVLRSACGVQPGRIITFRNSVTGTGACAIPGGNSGTVLSGGDRAEAYLRPGGTPDGAFTAIELKRLRMR